MKEKAITTLNTISTRITIPSILLILYLAYPLLYVFPFVHEVDYRFEIYYFFVITIVQIVLLFKPTRTPVRLSILIVTLTLCFFVILNILDLRYSKPLLFFLFLISLIPYLSKSYQPNKKLIYIFLILNILISFVLLFSKDRYPLDRFIGYTLTPTAYSVFLEVILVLILVYVHDKKLKIITYFIIIFFIFLTKTRLNLAFALLLPFLYYLLEYKVLSKRIIYTSFIILLNFLYPIYELINKTSLAQSIIEDRYGENRDASFGLRAYLHQVGINEIKDSSFFQFLFGHGAEYSRLLVERVVGYDLYIHNDFIRLIIDFGIIFTVLYLIYIYKIAKTNNAAFLLLLLYIFSFYHNMVYTFFMIGLIHLLSKNDSRQKFKTESL